MNESKQWKTKADNPTVQQCCLAYGGSSFSGPMRNALMCHLSILRQEHPEWETTSDLLEALRRAYYLLEMNNINDSYFEALRLELGDLLPSQIVDAEALAKSLCAPGIDEADIANAKG